MDLEEVLLRNGGTWRQLKRLEASDYRDYHLPDFRAISTLNYTLAQRVALQAVRQGDYNDLEDGEPQPLG